MQLGFCLSESVRVVSILTLTVFCHRISLVNQTPLLTKMVTGSWWMMMVTLHEPDFRSLEVTVLQTADRGIILCFLSPLYLKTNQLSTSYFVLKYRIELSTNPYHGFVIPVNYKSFGTPTLIRTERTTPFERVDFTNLSMGAY